MTRIRRTTKAADDLGRIMARIGEDNFSEAQLVAKTIYSALAGLRTFPYVAV